MPTVLVTDGRLAGTLLFLRTAKNGRMTTDGVINLCVPHPRNENYELHAGSRYGMQATSLCCANVSASIRPMEKSIAVARLRVGNLRFWCLDSASKTARQPWPREPRLTMLDDLRGNWRDRGA